MKRIRAMLIVTALAAGSGYVFYRYVLTDEDKAAIESMASSAKELCDEIATRVRPLVGQHEGARDTSNRDMTMRQWSNLGY